MIIDAKSTRNGFFFAAGVYFFAVTIAVLLGKSVMSVTPSVTP